MIRRLAVAVLILVSAASARAGDPPVAPPPGPLDAIHTLSAALAGSEPDTAKVDGVLLWRRYGLPGGSKELAGDLVPLIRAIHESQKEPEAKVIEDGGTAPHRFAVLAVAIVGKSFRAMLVEEDGWKIAHVAAADAAVEDPAAKPAALAATREVVTRVDEAAEAVIKTIDGHDTKGFVALAAPALIPASAPKGEDPGEALVARLHEAYGQRPHRFGSVSLTASGDSKSHPKIQVIFGGGNDKEDAVLLGFVADDVASGALRLESVADLELSDFVPRAK